MGSSMLYHSNDYILSMTINSIFSYIYDIYKNKEQLFLKIYTIFIKSSHIPSMKLCIQNSLVKCILKI